MLKNKTAVVTGGTRGIGLAIVKKYLENGASVALSGFLHDTGRRLGADENRFQINVQNFGELFQRIVIETGTGGDTGVVGQNIQAAEPPV